jgi:uncharacterized protein (TIGR04255 family)
MGQPQHYPNAPITEAIIDVRVKPASDQKVDSLLGVRGGEELNYPRVESIFQAVGVMEVQPGQSASALARQHQTGYKFVDAEGKNVWQCRQNGFTLGRLAPYDSWQPFRDEAQRLWSLYRERLKPEEVRRLAVRYINRIDLPEQPVELKKYFRTVPEVSPELPQPLTGFFMQLRMPQDDLKAETLINQTIIPPARAGVVSVVLDIDLFRSNDVPQDDEGIWAYFEQLHVRKNEVFESCITDDTRGLFA